MPFNLKNQIIYLPSLSWEALTRKPFVILFIRFKSSLIRGRLSAKFATCVKLTAFDFFSNSFITVSVVTMEITMSNMKQENNFDPQ